jgi:tetratricopeptide (TPR) repeat protein
VTASHSAFGLRPLVALLLTLLCGCSRPAPAVATADAVRRGDVLMASGKYVEASVAYRSAAGVSPLDGDVRLKLAKAYEKSGKWTEAAKEAVRAADLLPGNRDAQLYAIDRLLSTGQFIDATDRIAPILRAEPDNPAVLILSGNASAHLLNSTWAMYQLDDAIRAGREVTAERTDLRPRTSPDDDKAAEAAFRKALRLAPDLTEAQFALADLLWETGREEEAEPLLKRAADRNPTHILANRLLGLFYASRGRSRDAEHYLKVAAATGDEECRLTLVDFYLREKRTADAVATLDAVAAAGGAGAVAAARRAADLEFQMGEAESALRHLDALLARAPRDAPALTLKAQLLLARGQTDVALETARAAVAAGAGPAVADSYFVLGRVLSARGDNAGAFDQCSEALRRNPDLPGVLRELTRLALTLGHDDQALAFARRDAGQNPNDAAATLALVKMLARVGDWSSAELTLKPLLSGVPASADVLAESGIIQSVRGNNGPARASLLRALQLAPGSFDALSGLVTLDVKERQVAAARRRITEALSVHRNDSAYLVLDARVSVAENDLRRAESTLRAVLAADRANADAAVLLADVLARGGRADEARTVLEQQLTDGRTSLNVQLALAHLLEQMGRVDDARTRYEKIVADFPSAGAAGARLAAIYVDQGRNLDQALTLAVAAKQQLPDDPAVSDALGWVYVRKDFATTGRPHLEDAVRAAPDNPLYRYHLGVAYQRAGQSQKARDEFARVVALAPDSREAADARAALGTAR